MYLQRLPSRYSRIKGQKFKFSQERRNNSIVRVEVSSLYSVSVACLSTKLPRSHTSYNYLQYIYFFPLRSSHAVFFLTWQSVDYTLVDSAVTDLDPKDHPWDVVESVMQLCDAIVSIWINISATPCYSYSYASRKKGSYKGNGGSNTVVARCT